MTVILGHTRCEGCGGYATTTICLWPNQIVHCCADCAREENYGRG